MATNVLTVVRGENKTLLLTVVDSEGATVDLTGATCHFSVKRRVTDADPALIHKQITGVLSSHGQILNQMTNEGQAQFLLVPADTQTLAATDYVYDAWVVFSGGDRHDVVQPTKLNIIAGVTVLP